MSDPTRLQLLEASDRATALEQELLASLAPPASARTAVWNNLRQELGLVAGGVALTGAVTAVHSANAAAGSVGTVGGAGAGVAGSGIASSGVASSAFVVKAIAAAAVAGSIIGGSVYLVGFAPNPTPTRTVQHAAPTQAASAVAVPAPTIAVSELDTPPLPPSSPVTGSDIVRSPRRAAAQSAAPQAEDLSQSLARENAALRQARAALQAGRSGEALQTLTEMDQAFPAGALGQERAVLRIQALQASGDRVQAQTLAARFLQRYPSSPYASPLRSIANGDVEK